jgi:signal transduction histidine kinase
MTADPARSARPRGAAALPRPLPAGATVQRLFRASIVEDAGSRWPLGRIIGVGMATLGTVLIAAIVVGSIAIGNLSSASGRVVNVIDPAALHGAQLYSDLLNQETGVRGYLLSAQQSFLQPYHEGLADQRLQLRELQPLLTGFPAARADLAETVRSIEVWRSRYAVPAIARVAASGKPMPDADIDTGKGTFDSVRAPLAAFQHNLAAERATAVAQLSSSATILDVTGIVSAIALLLVVIAIGLALRAAAIRPLARLAAEARQVAGGDFDHQVDPSGPREVHTLAVDVDRMRERILHELSAVKAANIALQARALDLERSNSELEQFAYVASHDLQEPLRKVASFSELLRRRYYGRLDARADQYIDFAVDGATRMQALIDDLLAFSRVGRIDREPGIASCASALSQARVNLNAEIRATGTVIESAELPSVRAEFSLLTSLFQNLLGNAIKFRDSDLPPFIRISVGHQSDGFWLFSFADNGIGIEPEYAERIFVIFQRLHARSAYEGTGIGLAMCRRIVEHYGGQIWLDTTQQGGANFCFTLPVAPVGDEETSDE